MPRQTIKDLNLKVDENFSRLDSKIDALKRSGGSAADPNLVNKIAGIEREIKGLTSRLNVQTRSIAGLKTTLDEMNTPVTGKNVLPEDISWMRRQWLKMKNRIEKLRNG